MKTVIEVGKIAYSNAKQKSNIATIEIIQSN